MSKKFYICTVEFFDPDPNDGNDPSWRATVDRHIFDAPMTTHGVFRPFGNRALVKVECDDHSVFDADPDIVALDDLPLDNNMNPGQRNRINNALSNAGFTVVLDTSHVTYRDALSEIAKEINADEDFNGDWL